MLKPANHSAKIQTLKQKAVLLQQIRRYFEALHYWEVDTPLLCRESVIDLHLEPFRCHLDTTTNATPYFLQTSPEFCMKRLLVAGAERIYQLTHAFREDEFGPLHNPEFLMLEWYAVGTDQFEQMQFVETLCRKIARESSLNLPALPFERLSYAAAFDECLNLPVLNLTAEDLKRVAMQQLPHAVPEIDHRLETDVDFWRQLLLTEMIEPELRQREAVFLYNYPHSQAALARTCPDDKRVAERFELYLHGIEICNGYRELLDVEEFQRRSSEQNQLRQQRGLSALPEPSHFIAAMQQGLPDCTGVALGVDRLIMLALGCDRLEQVLAFPWDQV